MPPSRRVDVRRVDMGGQVRGPWAAIGWAAMEQTAAKSATELVLAEPIRYRVVPAADGSYAVFGADGTRGFRAPVTNRCPKLYSYSRDGQLVYVGVAIRGITARLRDGMKPTGRNGYHGYSWRKDGKPADLDVWLLTHADGSELHKHALECVECEVVYAYRSRFGQWPMHQTEIHFRQIDAIHTRLAERILDRFPVGPAKP